MSVSKNGYLKIVQRGTFGLAGGRIPKRERERGPPPPPTPKSATAQNIHLRHKFNFSVFTNILCSDEETSHNKLKEMVEKLSRGLTNVKHEQEYMEVRERVHRQSKLKFIIKVI